MAVYTFEALNEQGKEVRSEVEASHAAAALRWTTGQKAAVVTSIGPGALHALAASLVPASDGIGVWYLFGDETTEDEGPNMQQIPKAEQGLFLRLCQTMGEAYCLHTPQAVSVALRRGLNAVDHPYRAGPFYLLLPMNTQCTVMRQFNLTELPVGPPPPPAPAKAWQEATAGKDLGNPIAYHPKTTFELGQVIIHGKFGVGVVMGEKEGGKIIVVFENDTKVLVHGRG